MGLTYLTGDDDISAAHMTALFGELERKVVELLSGKTPLIVQIDGLFNPFGSQTIPPLLGNRYYFTTGSGPILGPAQNYDHTVFQDGLATVTEGTKDESLKTVEVSAVDSSFYAAAGIYAQSGKPFADLSLEAHKRGEYYILQTTIDSKTPQKKYRYAVAEMIYEGEGFETVEIPQAWDKYNFFRFHNCNSYPMRVTFQLVPDFFVDIDPWGIQTVRRETISTGYEKRWHYFWPFHAGDPRFYHFPDRGTRNNPWDSLPANNVANPCILYEWIANFDYVGDINPECIRWFRDRHAVYDIGGDYPTLFGDAHNQTTIIGDLLHHKGRLKTISRKTADGGATYTPEEVEFKGYGTIVADLAAGHITATDTGPALRIQGTAGDLENIIQGIGTNLTDGATPDATGYTLDSHKPPDLLALIEPDQFTQTFGYAVAHLDAGQWDVPPGRTISYSSSTFAVTWNTLKQTQFPPENSREIRIHADTLAEVLTLNAFGSEVYEPTNQDTPKSNLSARGAKLTITGLKLQFEQRFIFEGSMSDHEHNLLPREPGDSSTWNFLSGLAQYLFTPSYGILDGVSSIIVQKTISFDGYGWPAQTSRAPAFLTPRRDRAYNDPVYSVTDGQASYAHPNARNDPSGPSGADITIKQIRPAYEKVAGLSKLAALTMAYPAWPKMFPLWGEPDGLYDYVKSNNTSHPSIKMPRFYLLIEAWNDMAALVNSITGCFPLHAGHVPFDVGGVPVRLLPNAEGAPFGISESSVRPLNQFSRVNSGSDFHNLCLSLDIPIKTEADFPASYQELADDDGFSWDVNLETHQVTLVNTLQATTPVYGTLGVFLGDLEQRMNHYKIIPGPKFELTDNGFKSTSHDFYAGQEPVSTIPTTHLWVTIEDVRNAAEVLGLKFVYRELSVPLELQRFEGTPEMMWPGPPATPVEDEFSYLIFKPSPAYTPADSVYVEAAAGGQTIWPEEFTVGYIRAFPFTLFGLPGSIWAWIPSGTPDWKTSQAYPEIADYGAGDVFTSSTDPSAVGVAYQQILQIPFPEELRAEFTGRCVIRPQTVRKKLVYQRFISAGAALQNESHALLSAVPWIGHTSTDFSAQSMENAQAVWQRLVDVATNDVLPLEEKTSPAGTGNVDLEDEGETIIAPAAGAAAEVVIYLGDRISL